MNRILFTTYPDQGPCIMVITDMPIAEADQIEHTQSEAEVQSQIIALGYEVRSVYTINAVMDWVNGFVEER